MLVIASKAVAARKKKKKEKKKASESGRARAVNKWLGSSTPTRSQLTANERVCVSV